MKNLNLSKIGFSKKGKLLGWGTKPENDWKIMFIGFVMMIVIVFTLSAYYFIKVERGDVLVQDGVEVVEVNSFNLNRLRQLIKNYQERMVRFEQSKSNPDEILDPSL
ncbi:MAG: hypothetical protein M3Q24_01555 [bacterium]|nr:hypothetical protein [bacterium]